MNITETANAISHNKRTRAMLTYSNFFNSLALFAEAIQFQLLILLNKTQNTYFGCERLFMRGFRFR